MFTLIAVLITITCVLLILIVLVQNSKGGGLASNFQSSNQVMGVRRTTDFLEKATWTLAASLVVLSLLASVFIPKPDQVQDSVIENRLDNTFDPSQVPQFPTTVPGQDEGDDSEQ